MKFVVNSSADTPPDHAIHTRLDREAHAPVEVRVGKAHLALGIILQRDEEGVIVAVGGMTGGFSMFIKGGRLMYDYNFLDGVHYNLVSEELPEGPTELKFKFNKTVEFGGIGELYINGKKVDEVDMPKMHISTYSLAETFDVGRDTGTQVTKFYNDPFIFNGKLEKVVILMTD